MGDAISTYTDEQAPPLKRLESYIDYCFDTYSVVSNTLDRDQIQACVADWDRRRGQCKHEAKMDRQMFNKQVRSSHRRYEHGHYAIFIAEALIGVLPPEDKGVGWKSTTRHELGHAIDYEERGTSDHGREFKSVMSRFGEDSNNGQHAHGWAPRSHR